MTVGEVPHWVVLGNLFCCFFMTGLIWLVQMVHYPSFRYVEESQFVAFEAFHAKSISWIVGPVMILELIMGILLAVYTVQSHLFVFALVTLGALVLVWLMTFFSLVPIHSSLGKRKDHEVIAKLVSRNWPRTVLWSLRSGVLAVFVLSL